MIRIGARAMEMKVVDATLTTLLDVLEILVGEYQLKDFIDKWQILEEVIHGKSPDQANIFSLHNDSQESLSLVLFVIWQV